MKRVLLTGLVLVAGLSLLNGCGEARAPQTETLTETMVPTEPAAVTVVAPTATAAAELLDPVVQAGVSAAFESDSVAVGDTVVAIVSVDGVTDLYGVELHLAYSGDLLDVMDTEPEVDGIQIGNGSLLAVEFIVLNRCDEGQGLIDYAATQMPPTEGVSGGGEIARITFKAAAPGTAELRILTVLLANGGGKAIPAEIPVEASVVTVE